MLKIMIFIQINSKCNFSLAVVIHEKHAELKPYFGAKASALCGYC